MEQKTRKPLSKEDEKLLYIDLSARVPYGVRFITTGSDFPFRLEWIDNRRRANGEVRLEHVIPILRPMSSMTLEEREDFWKNVLDIDWRELEFDEEPDEVPFPFTENDCGFYIDNLYLTDLFAVIDWFNEHHFDWRGLIPKGIALSTEEFKFNPYKNQ